MTGGISTTETSLQPWWNSTLHPTIVGDRGSDDVAYETAEFAVPMAVTGIVLIVLCVVVAITKVRRRQLREQADAQGHTNETARVPSVSVGVPMNAAAFQQRYYNLPTQSSTTSSSHNDESVPYPPQETYLTQPPSYSQLPIDLPPSYEDSIKDMNYESTGVINMGFQSSSQNLGQSSSSITEGTSTSRGSSKISSGPQTLAELANSASQNNIDAHMQLSQAANQTLNAESIGSNTDNQNDVTGSIPQPGDLQSNGDLSSSIASDTAEQSRTCSETQESQNDESQNSNANG